ncbi:MAG: hypothetical protein KAR79_02420 [Simkaniaceae bacterium]|nr:hypothetical protein [Simkaniaceae bacterium]
MAINFSCDIATLPAELLDHILVYAGNPLAERVCRSWRAQMLSGSFYPNVYRSILEDRASLERFGLCDIFLRDCSSRKKVKEIVIKLNSLLEDSHAKPFYKIFWYECTAKKEVIPLRTFDLHERIKKQILEIQQKQTKNKRRTTLIC